MSEEVNSVSFFFGLLLSRKANLSNSWRRVSLSSRSPPPPHFLRTNKLLLSHTHTLAVSNFCYFHAGGKSTTPRFPPPREEKKGNLNSFLSLRAISVTVSWRLWERGRGRKKKGDRGEGASRFWQGGGKEEEGGNTEERLFFLREFVCNSECFLFPATSQLAT